MKNPALNIAAFAVITLFTSCEDKKKQTTPNLVVAEIVTEGVPEKVTGHLYVTAASGLSLREYNNLNSKKLAVMPYGTKVEVLLAEKNKTMNISGISGGMHQVAYNNKIGYAFSGYLSELFPPERGANAKRYVSDLQNTHPRAALSALVGGTASEPSNTETLLIPTTKWHEAYLIAQKLYEIPRSFALPEPNGKEEEVLNNPNKSINTLVSELQVIRIENALLKILFTHASQSFRRTVSITQQDSMMKIEEVRFVH
jgi:hypothetical protein